MVKRPLGVTTHTALGTPVSVNSTCSWPPSGIGDEHRAQVESGQLRDRRVVEVVDVERALQVPASSVGLCSTGGRGLEFRRPVRRKRRRCRLCLSVYRMPPSQTRMSAGGTVTTVATGCFGQPGLVERRDLDQLD